MSFSNSCFPRDQFSNLNLLLNREKGTLFRVSKGSLQKVEGFWAHVSYYWNRRDEQTAVKAVITRALDSYNLFLLTKRAEENDRSQVCRLFNRMRLLSPNVFDKSPFFTHNKLSEYCLPEKTVRLKIGERYLDFKDETIKAEDPKFIEFDLGSVCDNENLARLLKRKKGEKLWVGGKEDYEKMQKVVTRVLRRLSLTLKNLTPSHKVALEKIFTEGPLPRMKSTVYRRGAVEEGSKLEKILDERLGFNVLGKKSDFEIALKNYKTARDKAKAKAGIEAKLLILVIAEYLFAQKLGLELERISHGGSGGARFAFDRYYHKLLVVKPGDEGPHGNQNPNWFAKVKRWFISPRRCLRGNSEPQSEVSAYLLDRLLQVYQVPPTAWVHLKSSRFYGDDEKECSAQMYVKHTGTLSEYVGFHPLLHNLPRPLLRWYFSRSAKRKELLEKIPRKLAEKIAIVSLITENLDCHLENILVIVKELTGKKSVIERLFNDEEVEDEEIEDFVKHFFKEGYAQVLLQALFSFENGVALVQLDGGSSNPKKHPNSFFGRRFEHFFEVLPHYESSFSSRRSCDDEAFIRFLLVKGARSICGLNERSIFKKYWQKSEYRQRFKSWLLASPKQESGLRVGVCDDILEINPIPAHKIEGYKVFFSSQLERIYWNRSTRMDSWNLLKKYRGKQTSMRQVLSVRGEEDFLQELGEADQRGLMQALEAARGREVKEAASSFDGEHFDENSILSDLGEAGSDE